MTFLRRAAQLVQDLRTLDVLTENDKAVLKFIRGRFHLCIFYSEHSVIANDEQAVHRATVLKAVNEEFSEDEIEIIHKEYGNIDIMQKR